MNAKKAKAMRRAVAHLQDRLTPQLYATDSGHIVGVNDSRGRYALRVSHPDNSRRATYQKLKSAYIKNEV